MFHYVYVLQNNDKELRTGYTLNLAWKLEQYNKDPAENKQQWKVIYCEAYPHVSDAVRRAEYLQSIHGAKLIKQKLQRYLWK